MAALLALISAALFALAATLQQLGQLVLARKGEAVKGVGGLFRLVLVPAWLLGTLVLLVGYATQGAALDRGRLVVGAFVVVFGLALFDKPVINDLHVYEERLTRPTWHVFVAITALLAARAGATIITLANRETQMPGAAAPGDDRARQDPVPA